MSGAAPRAWAGIVGQSAAVALLQRAIAADRLAHAYAFVGPSGVGRRLAAVAFGQAALCAAEGCGTCATCRRVAAGQGRVRAHIGAQGRAPVAAR